MRASRCLLYPKRGPSSLTPSSLRSDTNAAPSVDLFSLFVRELYDEDAFVFFLYARSIVVDKVGLNLKDLDSRINHDQVDKRNLKEGTYTVTKRHTFFPISDVSISKEVVLHMLRAIIPPSSDHSSDLHSESVHSIRRHVLWMCETR